MWCMIDQWSMIWNLLLNTIYLCIMIEFVWPCSCSMKYIQFEISYCSFYYYVCCNIIGNRTQAKTVGVSLSKQENSKLMSCFFPRMVKCMAIKDLVHHATKLLWLSTGVQKKYVNFWPQVDILNITSKTIFICVERA